MSKVMVTGAGGCIGTELVRSLIAKNHQVFLLDKSFIPNIDEIINFISVD